MDEVLQGFAQNIDINRKSTLKNNNITLSISDIRNIAILRYGSVSGFGRAIGITHGTASQLLSGKYIPVRPEGIKKIADALGVDIVFLTQIYSELKNEAAKNE